MIKIKTTFKVGQTVWYLVAEGYKRIKCNVCKGKPIKGFECKKCYDVGSVAKPVKKAVKAQVVGIIIKVNHFKKEEKESTEIWSEEYELDGTACIISLPKRDTYRTRKEAEKEAV